VFSRDLPLLKTFCGAEGLENVINLSTLIQEILVKKWS
jgi:peroxiredoxin